MGIGLALVRSVVQLHDGTVSAASDGPGKGSVFTVTLPLGTPSEANGARGEATPAPAHAEGAAAERSVLIADDLDDVAWTLATVLEASGLRVRTARSGAEAMAAIEEHRPDVAVIDIAMPGMSGYELAERLRATAHGKRMLLVALTGWGSDSDRQASLQAGFDAHLVKPVAIDELKDLIAGWSPPAS